MNRLMYKENLYLRKQNLKLEKKIDAIFKKENGNPQYSYSFNTPFYIWNYFLVTVFCLFLSVCLILLQYSLHIVKLFCTWLILTLNDQVSDVAQGPLFVMTDPSARVFTKLKDIYGNELERSMLDESKNTRSAC